MRVLRVPRVLDLYCGAGGASWGYYCAGFNVVGVDLFPQRNYPRKEGFDFWQQDAIDVLREVPIRIEGLGISQLDLSQFDLIHASPPCQAYSDLQKQNKITYPDLIAETREALIETGIPYVIENVEGAPLTNPVTLCGVFFPPLRVIRHRLFECSFPVHQPEHFDHPLCYTMDKRKNHYGKMDEWKDFVHVNGGGNCSVAAARDAMGIDWMTKKELNQAIPPRYTDYIGGQFLEWKSSQSGGWI